ncbi:TRAP transporter substrate-binding protein [Endozoicomonas arenosclerae]|uniref:TRAP transporter substrate-binding protein n=1 Tax=Endozoicomonas arenosclerae TaxID=1633495 RepID=UPI000A4F8213|nr:TRAP transporter substrate-binding protein [Endozoicomonas arenosclerae]
MMKRYSNILNLVGITLLCLASTCTWSEQSVTLKLAHNLNQKHMVHKAAVYMDQQLNVLSKGNLRLRIYPAGQMGDAVDTLQMLQHGIIDMTKGTASDLELFDKTFAIFNLPYLFESPEHFNKVVFGPVGREIMASPTKKGFFAIAAYETRFRSFYARKPIHSPKDLKGMKVRVQPSPTVIEMVKLMGGTPTPIPFGETYTALQQGVVDMAENNEPSYVDTRHFEVARYFSEDQHSSVPDYLMISTQTWNNKLTESQRNMIRIAAERSEKYQQTLWNETLKNARETASKSGVTFIEVDKTAFREAIKPLYKQFSKDPQQAKLLEKIQSAASIPSSPIPKKPPA